MDFDVVFVAGPQGAGKGTQGKLLAEKLGFFFWDTGVILREIIREGGPLREKVSVSNQGTLLSDEVIIEVLKTRLPAIPPDQGIILEGVPRRMGQADFLLDYLKEKGKRVTTVFINLPREESLRRLLLRAKKEGRADDTPEGIETRLRYYDEVIKPTIEYLREKTTFVEIDGSLSVPEVAKNINAALGLN